MKKQIKLVEDFHKKFNSPKGEKPSLITEDRSKHRYDLMLEEVKEYAEGVKNKDLNNIAKELADVLYSVYGAIIEHGLQDKIEEIFQEVHNSNMSKDYGKYKAIKGENFFKADIQKILEKQE